jgi:hypothetical protein
VNQTKSLPESSQKAPHSQQIKHPNENLAKKLQSIKHNQLKFMLNEAITLEVVEYLMK